MSVQIIDDPSAVAEFVRTTAVYPTDHENITIQPGVTLTVQIDSRDRDVCALHGVGCIPDAVKVRVWVGDSASTAAVTTKVLACNERDSGWVAFVDDDTRHHITAIEITNMSDDADYTVDSLYMSLRQEPLPAASHDTPTPEAAELFATLKEFDLFGGTRVLDWDANYTRPTIDHVYRYHDPHLVGLRSDLIDAIFKLPDHEITARRKQMPLAQQARIETIQRVNRHFQSTVNAPGAVVTLAATGTVIYFDKRFEPCYRCNTMTPYHAMYHCPMCDKTLYCITCRVKFTTVPDTRQQRKLTEKKKKKAQKSGAGPAALVVANPYHSQSVCDEHAAFVKEHITPWVRGGFRTCSHCGKPDALVRCEGCTINVYCSEAHRLADLTATDFNGKVCPGPHDSECKAHYRKNYRLLDDYDGPTDAEFERIEKQKIKEMYEALDLELPDVTPKKKPAEEEEAPTPDEKKRPTPPFELPTETGWLVVNYADPSEDLLARLAHMDAEAKELEPVIREQAKKIDAVLDRDKKAEKKREADAAFRVQQEHLRYVPLDSLSQIRRSGFFDTATGTLTASGKKFFHPHTSMLQYLSAGVVGRAILHSDEYKTARANDRRIADGESGLSLEFFTACLEQKLEVIWHMIVYPKVESESRLWNAYQE